MYTCFLGGGGLVAKSCLTLATPWTVAHQAPLSRGFSRQEHWSGLPFPSPGDLPDPGTEPGSPALRADSSPTEPLGSPEALTQSGTRLSDVTLTFKGPTHVSGSGSAWRRLLRFSKGNVWVTEYENGGLLVHVVNLLCKTTPVNTLPSKLVLSLTFLSCYYYIFYTLLLIFTL
ncbi:unnamed protein product [Rangifer tarandus platyrhynchus]|uniref:Uncharacterized protein n=1 Tax=Rangifer tarandus platyrhynchus TaxID=3082113 RepID=A0AC59YKA9_RANTA